MTDRTCLEYKIIGWLQVEQGDNTQVKGAFFPYLNKKTCAWQVGMKTT
jgi:hypothetical protein